MRDVILEKVNKLAAESNLKLVQPDQRFALNESKDENVFVLTPINPPEELTWENGKQPCVAVTISGLDQLNFECEKCGNQKLDDLIESRFRNALKTLNKGIEYDLDNLNKVNDQNTKQRQENAS